MSLSVLAIVKNVCLFIVLVVRDFLFDLNKDFNLSRFFARFANFYVSFSCLCSNFSKFNLCKADLY